MLEVTKDNAVIFIALIRDYCIFLKIPFGGQEMKDRTRHLFSDCGRFLDLQKLQAEIAEKL